MRIIETTLFDHRKQLLQYQTLFLPILQFPSCTAIRRYITKNPKLPASIELKEIVALMVHTDKASFTGALQDWFEKWEWFLNERTINPETAKSHYTHKKLRSAYNSLKRNLDVLFTWYDHKELEIPNTTNAIDGQFSDLKQKMRNHNGMNMNRKKRFIIEFLKA